MDIISLLKNIFMLDITDIIITVGSPIMIRKMGDLVSIDTTILTPQDCEAIIKSALNESQWEQFVNKRELDTSISISGLSRFRINCFWQRNSPGMAIRPVPLLIKSLNEIGLPPVIYELVNQQSGLILITGPTGQGKSTTLAAIIEYINQTKMSHIVTIEDPIEFLFKNKKSIIEQREVGSDTLSFTNALKHVLRQNPNTIMIGELRDLETIQLALTIAETGHLVLSTLHTTNSAQAISRIIDIFPAQSKRYISLQLAMVLNAIVSQRLIKRADERGFVLALELMKVKPSIRNMIKEHNLQNINDAIQTGMDDGMITLNKSLEQLIRNEIITFDEASHVSSNVQELTKIIER
ncbi:MAG: PilT/PilU family type 4a pilus ATPase [bacterium]